MDGKVDVRSIIDYRGRCSMRLHVPCGCGRVMGHGCALAIGSRSHRGIALHSAGLRLCVVVEVGGIFGNFGWAD